MPASPVGNDITRHEAAKTDDSPSASSAEPQSSKQNTHDTNIKPHHPSISCEPKSTPDISHTIVSDRSSFLNIEDFETIDEASITLSSQEPSSLSRLSREFNATFKREDHHWPSYQRHNQSHRNSTPNRARYANVNSYRQQSNNNVIFGKGKSTGIRAINSRSNQSNGNKTITGTFISRLDPRTTSRDLALHIHREFGLTVRPEKLQIEVAYAAHFISQEAEFYDIIN